MCRFYTFFGTLWFFRKSTHSNINSLTFAEQRNIFTCQCKIILHQQYHLSLATEGFKLNSNHLAVAVMILGDDILNQQSTFKIEIKKGITIMQELKVFSTFQ